MSSFLQKTIKNIKSNSLRRMMLKRLYRKNHLSLDDFKSFNDRFFLYKVNGKYIPSETINWFTSYEYQSRHTHDISLYKYKPKKGDVVVDIGAGLGEEALIISDMVGDEGKVYSIEANPTVFSILKQTIELNKLGNVKIFHLAINRTDEMIKMEDSDATYMTGNVSNKGKASTIDVKGQRFDSFMDSEGISKIDLLKCNIEGAERFFIDSIRADYMPRIKNVAIACHDFRYHENQNDFFVTKQYVKDFLTSHSFEVETQNTGVDYVDDWVYGRNLKTT